MVPPTHTHRRSLRSRLRRPTWRGWFSIALAVVIVGIITAWGIDYATLHSQISRNVTIENVNVGRLAPPALESALKKANAVYGPGSVDFVINGKVTRLKATDIGLHLDEAATVSAARKVGRNDPVVLKPVMWAASFFRPRHAPVRITLDRAKLATALAGLPGQVAVKEPTLVGSPDTVGVSAGQGGYGFNPSDVANEIAVDARTGTLPIRVALVARPLSPTVSTDEVRALAVTAYNLTAQPIQLVTPQEQMTATPALLRSWISSVIDPATNHAQIVIEPSQSVQTIERQIGGVQVQPVDAAFTVNGNQVVLIPGTDGARCCSISSGKAILAGLATPTVPVNLPMAPVAPRFTTAAARNLKITQLLGVSFSPPPVSQLPAFAPPVTDPPTTTNSTDPTVPPVPPTTTPPIVQPPPTQPGEFIVPVPNSSGVAPNVNHAIDALRGQLLLPGKSLSLNGVLGAPSPANGYVAAAVPTADGPTWVSGGGTDLVAAALFQASIAGGLDIPASQRHGTAVPGTPLGFEATIGWTQPDLVIRNPSRNGVLIWVDQVPTGIRVQLFSTPWTSSITVKQQLTSSGPGGRCTAVTLTRTRQLLPLSAKATATSSVDTFSGTYAPTPGSREDPLRTACPT